MEKLDPSRMVTFKVEVSDWDDRYKVSEDRDTLYTKEIEVLSDDEVGTKYNGEGPYGHEIHLLSGEIKSVEAIKVRLGSARNKLRYNADEKICLNCEFYNWDSSDVMRERRGFLYPGELPITSSCMHEPQPIIRKCNSVGCGYFDNIHKK